MTLQIIIDIGESLLQPLDMGLNAWAGTIIRLEKTVVLRSKHFDELTAAREKITHLAGLLVRQCPYLRLHPGAEESEYPGVNGVGLGQGTGRAGEVAHLAGIDDCLLAGGWPGEPRPEAFPDDR